MVLALKQPLDVPCGVGKITESEYYSRYIDLNKVHVSHRYHNVWQIYNTLSQSRLILGGGCSSALLEALYLWKKVLMCDCYSEQRSYSIGPPVALNLRNGGYSIFCNAVSKVLFETENDYFQQRRHQISRLVGTPSLQAPDKIIRDLVQKEKKL